MKNKIKIALVGIVLFIGVQIGSGIVTTVQTYAERLNQQAEIIESMM